MTINRRTALTAAATIICLPRASSAASPSAPKPTFTNPLAAKINLYTVVTPDIAASIRFYCDVIGAYKIATQGRLAGPLPGVPGVGDVDRRFALLRDVDSLRGIRLLEAPHNAQANRPHPGSNPWDPGYCIIEGGTHDYDASYAKVTKAGIKTISPPMYYFFRDIKPLNNADRGPANIDVRSYAGFGPAGEEFYITCNVAQPAPRWTRQGLHSGFGNTVIAMLDRNPVWDFYNKAFGLLPTSDIECMQEGTNVLIGGPRDLYFRWGGLGEAVSIEWDEYRRPSGTTYATHLDRTGHAAFTITVDDLTKVRRALMAAGIEIAGEGALPNLDSSHPNGFFVRGVVGELIEVVGR